MLTHLFFNKILYEMVFEEKSVNLKWHELKTKQLQLS